MANDARPGCVGLSDLAKAAGPVNPALTGWAGMWRGYAPGGGHVLFFAASGKEQLDAAGPAPVVKASALREKRLDVARPTPWWRARGALVF